MTSDQAIKTFYYCGQFRVGERVTKVKGSSWTGKIVGVYTSSLTENGYCVESEKEPGSVQIYPETALRLLSRA